MFFLSGTHDLPLEIQVIFLLLLGLRPDIGLSLLASKGVLRVLVSTRLLYFPKAALK